MASIYGITAADIYDGTIKGVLAHLLIGQPTYIEDRVDLEIKDLAQRVGLYSTDQITPIPATGKLHYGIHRWAVSWLIKTILLDYIGQNNIENAGNDKYAYKYELYRREETELRKGVTKEMFLNIVVRNTDRSPIANIITRG
jgi:hypothetical protein